MQTVAVLGTGGAGSAMARRLLELKFRVHAWNRTESRARPLEDDGALVFPTAAEAVRSAGVVIVTVYDADAVLDVLGQIAGAVEPGAVVLQSATVGPVIGEIAETATRLGVTIIDAPFYGNPGPARRGELTLMVAGAPEHKKAVTPVLEALASNIVDVADQPGPASLLKLTCNAWLLGTNAMAVQAAVLAESFGLDPELFLRAVSGSKADSEYLHYRADHLTRKTDEVLSPVRAAIKDLGHIRSAAASAGASDILLAPLQEIYDRAVEAGLGDQDSTAIRAVFAR